MAIRIQVVVDEEEAARFKSAALRDSKSLSAWLRDAGRDRLAVRRKRALDTPAELKKFFRERSRKEQGKEPDWEEQKKLILQSYQGSNRP